MEKKELIEAMAQILDSKLLPMYRKIDRVENKMERLDKKLDRVEFRYDDTANRMDRVESRMDTIEKLSDQPEGNGNLIEDEHYAETTRKFERIGREQYY